MKSEVIEYIKNNDYIEKLLLDFMDDFKSKYDLLEDKYKNEILEIKDEIFRNWLYCSMINETNITPNYLINNIVQEKYPGNYTVLPILHYNFNNNHLNLYIDFNYCSMYDHPIIKDVETLIDLSTPSIIFKYEYENENESLLHIEEKLLKEFTIESQYYVNYLIQLCEKLEIIKELRAIKCKCFQKSKESQFWKLENKEKFIKIVNATIDLSIENINNINNIQKKVGKSQIIRFLDNGINDNDFNNFINEVLPYANDFIENINQFTEDKSILETIKFAQVLMGDNVGTFIMGTEIRVYFDVYFTSVFSYYLSILSPTYLGTFLMEEIVGGMKESSSCFEKNASIFNEELEHDLSNLGIELMNKKGKIIKPRKNYSINLNDIDKLMEQAKLEKEEVVYRYRKCLEMYGDDKNMIHKFMSIINDKEDDEYIFMEGHIKKFTNYLISKKGLKEKTIFSYSRDIELFICEYLCYEKEEELKQLDNTIVDNYLGEWFPLNYATGTASIKEQIYAIKHYFDFLLDEGLIDTKEKNKVYETIKNKDKYIIKYMQYLS